MCASTFHSVEPGSTLLPDKTVLVFAGAGERKAMVLCQKLDFSFCVRKIKMIAPRSTGGSVQYYMHCMEYCTGISWWRGTSSWWQKLLICLQFYVMKKQIKKTENEQDFLLLSGLKQSSTVKSSTTETLLLHLECVAGIIAKVSIQPPINRWSSSWNHTHTIAFSLLSVHTICFSIRTWQHFK